ncbi:hypothetical protein MRS44_013177 [Fusarium solani]|uniref:uncharacterized protein n=1 Tax=Fusarium solani TaxID=169388 RepID=UPI0032C490AF|nr:hypothetical protein MRS44_013177 [Fusarium solani]
MASSQTTAASTPSISDQPITGTSLDFFLFFKATYPDEDTQNATGGSRKRKSRGMVMYRCLHCPADKPWANRKRDNAWHHARRCHAQASKSIESIDYRALIDRFISIVTFNGSISIERASQSIDIDRSQIEIESIDDQIDQGIQGWSSLSLSTLILPTN